MNKRIFLWLGFAFLIPLGCHAPQVAVKPRTINLSRMYNPTSTRFHPAYTIYNNSPTTSILYVKIFPIELLYTGTIEPNKIVAQVNLTYILTDLTDPSKPAMADSGQMQYRFLKENSSKTFLSQVLLKTEPGKLYQLQLSAKDVIRREENLAYLYIDRTATYGEQDFKVIEPVAGTPVFLPYVVGNSLFKLECPDTGFHRIFVKYYGGTMPLPQPSFSDLSEQNFLMKPDSIWVLPFRSQTVYQLNYEGVYHFQLDTSKAEGLTLFNFGTGYPKVQDVDQMIPPLAYLTTTPEYNAIKDAINKKLAVDNFWLGRAGNIDKARELIRVYYNRVFFANYYFTSSKPGWKTDRGMIFIIYGPPQSVTVLPTQEKWVYYKNNYTSTVTFTFDYKPSPFALNNFVLERSDNYDNFWRVAVETWRKGNIYIIE